VLKLFRSRLAVLLGRLIAHVLTAATMSTLVLNSTADLRTFAHKACRVANAHLYAATAWRTVLPES
jgi:hypothetical protein